MRTTDDEFYIGYEAAMKPSIRRRVQGVVAAAVLTSVAAAVLVTLAERPLADTSFAYGRRQTWSGYLTRTPAPAILVPDAEGYRRH
jgi:hypothetical protein